MPAAASPTITPRQLHQRWNQQRMVWGVVITLILLTLSLLDHQGYLFYDGGDHRRYHQRTFTVTRIIDGDTLDIIHRDGKTTRLRLWGINCPEIAHPEHGRLHDEPFGPQATAFTTQLALNQRVQLQLEPQRTRDSFDRLLVYVTLPDGSVLNEQLLVAGLAKADERPDDPRFAHHYVKRYNLLEHQARLDRIGLWAVDAKETTDEQVNHLE